MRYRVDKDGDVTTLQIEGNLDEVTAPELRDIVTELVEAGHSSVTVDLSDLQFLDDAGVGVLVSLYKRIRANRGQVQIVGVRDQPLAIFRLNRLDRIFFKKPGAPPPAPSS